MRSLIAVVVFALVFGPSPLGILGSAKADLVAYWNLNDHDGEISPITADQGAGTLSFVGFLASDVTSPVGSPINLISPSLNGDSLGLHDSAGNGNSLDFSINLTGFVDPVLAFATRRNPQGFDVNSFSYSVDGGSSFSTPFSALAPSDSGSIFGLRFGDFSSFSAVDNVASLVLRYTLGGASLTSPIGYNYIDNIQINATAVPEPSAFLFVGLVCCVLSARVFRRHQQAE